MKNAFIALPLVFTLSCPRMLLANSRGWDHGQHDHAEGPEFDKDGRQIGPDRETMEFGPEIGREPPRQDEFEAAFPPREGELTLPKDLVAQGRSAQRQGAPPTESSAAAAAIIGAHFSADHPERVAGIYGEGPIASIEDNTVLAYYSTGARDWLGRPKRANIRMGYLPENPNVPFRGNILYLEGLSDSMLNHDNLFSELANAGYRVIAFDYMGQGGSTGRMNWTRLENPRRPGTEIGSIADAAWERFRRKDSGVADRKIVMGWSTGGLAAYRMAHRKEADAVILIAPAVGGVKLLSLASIRASIQLRIEDLTHADYSRENDPHKDPIIPSAPARVPLFLVNLLKTAWQSRNWKISDVVSGLALLSGDSDPLVNGGRTRDTLARNAPHFRVVNYPDSAHEVHNEIRSIRDAAAGEILRFLARLK